MDKGKFYVGIDSGTNSLGVAATDEHYQYLKYRGEPIAVTHLYDEASSNDDRRAARVARRRTSRRKYRIQLLRELFATEIAKKDPAFFKRLAESALWGDDSSEHFSLFADADYSDVDYHRDYPTIHHLICSLMKDDPIAVHDVRLVYLACAWLVKNRGHFLNEIDANSIGQFTQFGTVYRDFLAFFADNEMELPWGNDVPEQEIAKILKQKTGITKKKEALKALLYRGEKQSKDTTETRPYVKEELVNLLCGSSVELKKLFKKDEYGDLEKKSISLSDSDEDLQALYANIEETDAALIFACKQIYDWALLADIIGDYSTISEAKIAVYEQHKEDLKAVKRFVRRYLSDRFKPYFCKNGADSYAAYVGHLTGAKKTEQKEDDAKKGDDFLTSLKKAVKASGFEAKVDEADRPFLQDLIERLETATFLPLQVNTNNRVIPHQVYQFELSAVLRNAETYLPFLKEKDESGLSVSEKILSIFTFRIPYYVGPLRSDGSHAWIVRKEGVRITPWNFDSVVDKDASEREFIRRMINRCTYYPGADVLPKCSLLYQRFEVLNEINNLKINGQPISVKVKQAIYTDVFQKNRNVTKKKILDYLIANGHLDKKEVELVSGIDEKIKSSLSSEHDFKRLLESGALSREDAEKIIEHATYTEDRSRMRRWLTENYPRLPKEDFRYLLSRRYKDFGRLSKEFLDGGLLGVDRKGGTGEAISILRALWETNNNLMELLAEGNFTFSEALQNLKKEYAEENPSSFEERLAELYLSPAVKRQVYRIVDVLSDVVKAVGRAPDKIFLEMARGGTPDQKGKRTKTRREQILEFYQTVRDEDVPRLKKELEEMGEMVDNRLQSDKLFLYYLQLGKCLYSGEAIDLATLMTKDQSVYNIEHIYPQSQVKDDSILNNEILVLSKINGAKSDSYPVDPAIQTKMRGIWESYLKHGLITEEKYRRLIRTTPFTNEEKMGFINRQLTETRQSTKAVLGLLKELYPETEVVPVKAGLVSEFRQEFKLVKSRQVNDLHHAKDAYLNIAVGNVWHEKYTKKFFVDQPYTLKTKELFDRSLTVDGETVWEGEKSVAAVKEVMQKNAIHYTVFPYRKGGALFDLQPVKAGGADLVPLKKGLDPKKYGGYNKPAASFFAPVKYRIGKKADLMIVPVEVSVREKYLSDPAFAEEYAKKTIGGICSGKTVDEVSFPLGARILKINTVFSLDGFRVCLAGKSNGGLKVILAPITPLILSLDWEAYVKKLESFQNKQSKKTSSAILPDPEHDGITKDRNAELYDLLLSKLRSSTFSKRPNCPVETLENGYERFKQLNVAEQIGILLSVLQVFGRSSGGIDFRLIGGSKTEASVARSSNLSNWKKVYSDVRIIDQSNSGLFVKRSGNLLDLL